MIPDGASYPIDENEVIPGMNVDDFLRIRTPVYLSSVA